MGRRPPHTIGFVKKNMQINQSKSNLSIHSLGPFFEDGINNSGSTRSLTYHGTNIPTLVLAPLKENNDEDFLLKGPTVLLIPRRAERYLQLVSIIFRICYNSLEEWSRFNLKFEDLNLDSVRGGWLFCCLVLSWYCSRAWCDGPGSWYLTSPNGVQRVYRE